MIDRPIPRIERQVIVHERVGPVCWRRNGDDAVFIRPETLDGDGELSLGVAGIGATLRELGFNHADLFPKG